MVLKKLGDELEPHFKEVVSHLALREGLHVVVEPDMYAEHFASHSELHSHVFTWLQEDMESLSEHVDFVVCLGGDGVLLHSSALFQSTHPPVIAFNLGSLGFLTNHWYHDFRQDLSNVIFGSQSLASCSMEDLDTVENSLGVMVTLRMRLKCEVTRRGAAAPEQTIDVLNEMVIDRGPNAFLTNIECYEKGRFVTRVQADGIMLSTPTGSTAYSVSAGGSLVHPNVPAILLTPVCPHSLSFRPILLPDYADIEFRIPDDARNTAWVSFDGRSRQELFRGDRIRVRMSDSPVPTINKDDLTADWFESLERCFRWSDRTEQKALSVPQPTPLHGNGSPACNGVPPEASVSANSSSAHGKPAHDTPVLRANA
ncbi:hypothetical protein FOA52_008435 [Chlamydomonas sp. UWO 241]|nr:hypothetical protein FOA52_008435 [Chlamydomonas sp. UWO 241]